MRSLKAFTLVELAIVLVILGLLIGAVLAGQSMVRSAEERSVITSLQNYMTATWSFREKYSAYPGDLPNATEYWGTQDPTPATCQNTASTSQLTCNGDGDGFICAGGGECWEQYRFWQHLSNAGLIEGSYTGVAQNIWTQSGNVPGVNAPAMRISGVTVQPRDYGVRTGDVALYDGSYLNIFFIGIPACSQCDPDEPFLTTQEAWNADVKIDDGKPDLGRLRTWKYGTTAGWAIDSSACANSATQGSAAYNLLVSGIQCSLVLNFEQ